MYLEDDSEDAEEKTVVRFWVQMSHLNPALSTEQGKAGNKDRDYANAHVQYMKK